MNPSSYAIRIRPVPTELKIQPVQTGYNMLVAIANAELGNAFDALVKGFTADTPLENRAYTLVSTALFRACRHIYREHEGINQLVNASADILQMLEDRYGKKSILIASQIPVANWHDYIADPTLADAILDRIMAHNHRFELKGESLRRQQSNNPS